jgi:hypothetical protein
MRSRPEIDIKLPSSVFPGETFHVELVVTGRSVTPIDFIAVDFCVTNGTRNPANNSVFQSHETFHVSANVAKKGELREKVYRYRAAFEVPVTLSPTYLGAAIESRACVEVHIAIPWWLDVRERYDVTILPVPIARPKPEAITGSSLRGNKPFVEISLRAQCFAPGETIEGAVAFGNLGGSHAEDLEPALVGYETFTNLMFGPTDVKIEAHRHSAFLAVSNAGEGREIPFRLAVPASAPPSLSLPRGKLSWMLEARLNLRGAWDVIHRIPVTIAAFEGHTRVAGAEPIQIGAGRWHAVWDEAGSAAGLALEPKKLRLTGELSGCDVSVKVGKNDAKRSSLVARLRFRTWGLGLSLAKAGLLDRATYFPDEELERRFRITGRDPAQVREALIPSLRTALLAFDEVTLGDDEAEVHSDAPGYDQPWIGTFLGKVTSLALALDKASRHIRAPQEMAAFVPAWKRFAEGLDADLTAGNMAITGGEFEGAVFEIRTEFEGKTPAATTIELVIDPPLDGVLDLASAEAILQAPAAAREILGSLEALCRPLLFADDARSRAARAPSPDLREALVSIRLPVVIADPAALRDVMAALLSLAAALRGDRRAGPYR